MKRTLAMLLVLAIFCAFFFVAFEADHDCAGDDCRICGLLTACLRLVRFAAAAAILAAVAFVAGQVHIHSRRTVCVCRASLIEQKVKLSN